MSRQEEKEEKIAKVEVEATAEVPSPPIPIPNKYIKGKDGKMKINPDYYQSMLLANTSNSIKSKKIKETTTMTNTMTTKATIPTTTPLSLSESEAKASSSSQQEEWIPLINTSSSTTANNNLSSTAAGININTDTGDYTTNNNTIDIDSYDTISLAYLARLSREVYNFPDSTGTTTTGTTNEGESVSTTTEYNTAERIDNSHDDDSNNNVNTNTNTNANTNTKNEIIEVGPDTFTIHEITTTNTCTDRSSDDDGNENTNKEPKKTTTTITLIVAICGTFSPMQHLMNIMPHAYHGLYVGKEIFDGLSGNNNESDRNVRNTHTGGAKYDAYAAGHEHGWTEPAREIYTEVIHRLRLRHNGNDSDADADADADAEYGDGNDDLNTLLNDRYDRIIVTGHSRGGLLAYYVGLNMITGGGASNNSDGDWGRGYNGILRVVGFGMPSPLKEIPNNENNQKIIDFIKTKVISVVNRYDPVANNSLPTFVSNQNWNPIVVEIGTTTKRKKPMILKKTSTSETTTTTGGSGLWGLLGTVVATAVTVVADKATEVTYDIEHNHSIHQYEKLMTINPHDPIHTTSTTSIDYNNDDNNKNKNKHSYVLPSCGVVIVDYNNNNSTKKEHNNDNNYSSSSSSSSKSLQLLLPPP